MCTVVRSSEPEISGSDLVSEVILYTKTAAILAITSTRTAEAARSILRQRVASTDAPRFDADAPRSSDRRGSEPGFGNSMAHFRVQRSPLVSREAVRHPVCRYARVGPADYFGIESRLGGDSST
jgi:hypothetical protein